MYPDSSSLNSKDANVAGDELYFTLGSSAPEGDYGVKVNRTYSDGYNVSSYRNFTLDMTPPTVEEKPNSYVQGDEVQINLNPQDENGVVGSSVTGHVEGPNDYAKDFSESVVLSDLSEGTYSVEYSVMDQAGNWNNNSWSFTVDNSYDGSKDIGIQKSPGDYRVSGGNFVIPLILNATDNDESDIKIRCEMGSYSIESDWRKADESQYFECVPDTSEYADLSLSLNVIIRDRAGNKYTEEIGDYTFDRTSPTLEGVRTYGEVQNGDFPVEYSASDRSSGVAYLHYQLDNSEFDLSEGYNATVDGDTFDVDTSEIDSGSHTVYVWAVDGVGRTSTLQSVDFQYDPSARPEIDVAAEGLQVTAGERGTVTVNVSNTGELFVDKINLALESSIFNRSRDISSLSPGSQVQEAFTFQTDEGDLGVHNLRIDANPGSDTEAEITVAANEDQRERLESSLQKWLDRRGNLEENVTRLDSKVSKQRSDRLQANFSDFNSTVQRAMEAKQNGDYWKVSDVLDGIEAEYDVAKASFEEVRQEYRVSRNHRNIAFGFLMLMSFGGFGLGYALYSENFELELEALESAFQNVSVPQGSSSLAASVTAPFIGAYQSLVELLEEEEEEMESGFQGFT